MSNLIRKSKKGFTLIELMIVVAIIGILAAIAIPNFLRFQLKSKSSEGKVNLAAIRTAEESYLAEFGTYVAAAENPAGGVPGTSKGVFDDTAADFNQLGWSPEGQVFFVYAVEYNSTTPDAFTATAAADIDGNSTNQAWAYIKEIGTSTTGLAGTGEAAICVASGVGPAQDQFEQVGPCNAISGQSEF